MTLKELLHALADEKPVQRKNHDGTWHDASIREVMCAIGTGAFDSNDYRLKPTPVPPGDLTWEEAKALYRKGEKVEFFSPVPQVWCPVHDNFIHWEDQPPRSNTYAYRRTPAPKRVPLGPEDIKSTTQFRLKTVMKQVGATEEGINVVPAVIRWADLATSFERTDDDGTTWQECSKEVEA